jgi:hypothetical protein
MPNVLPSYSFAELTIGIICSCMPVVWRSCQHGWTVLVQRPVHGLSRFCCCCRRRHLRHRSAKATTTASITVTDVHTEPLATDSGGNSSTKEASTPAIATDAIHTSDTAPPAAAVAAAAHDMAIAAARNGGKAAAEELQASPWHGVGEPKQKRQPKLGHGGGGGGQRRPPRRARFPFPRLPRVPHVATMTGLRSFFGTASTTRDDAGNGTENEGTDDYDVESLEGDYYHAQLRAAAVAAGKLGSDN